MHHNTMYVKCDQDSNPGDLDLTLLAYLANLPIMHAQLLRHFEALSCDKRLQILEWLKDPRQHFRPQTDGDLVRDGVCGLLIAESLGISQSTTSRHMKQLTDAGLVRAKKIKQWTFYRRDEKVIQAMKRLIGSSL